MRKYLIKTPLLFLLFLCFLSSCHRKLHKQELSSGPKIHQHDNPFYDLNKEFRKIYAQTRKKIYTLYSPAIFALGDSLVLYRNGKRLAKRTTPEIYHNLKSLSHASLGVYVLLGFEARPELSEEKIKEIQDFQQLLKEVKLEISKHNLTQEQKEYNQKSLQMCIDYLQVVLDAGKIEYPKLQSFARQVDKLFALNVKYAVKAQVDLLHQVMNEWYQDFSEKEKKQLKVVISGPKVAREQALLTQYFAKFLGQKGENHQIIYAEGIFNEKGLQKTLGTDVVDTQVGVGFFKDPERMHRDLLSDEAAEYIKTLKFH